MGPERRSLMHGAILDEKMGAQVRELRFHVAGHQFDNIKYLNFLECFHFYDTSHFCPFFPQNKYMISLHPPSF